MNVTIELPTELFVLLTVDPVIESYNQNIEPEPSTSDSTERIEEKVIGERSNSPVNAKVGDQQVSLDTTLIAVENSYDFDELIDQILDHIFEQIFDQILKQIYDTEMAATTAEKLEYIRAASQMINRSYSGDPLSRASFVNSVKLLKSVTAANLNAVLLEFVISKLEGKALECIPPNPENVDAIIAALERDIQPDSSKVITGRLLALKSDRAKIMEFTEQAEKLADALQRSLIVEGIPQAKAREMSIEKTVEVCRGVARSDLAKSILAATKFDSPKEVIAKYVVESSTEEKEKQILAFKANRKQNGRNNGYHVGGKNQYHNGNGRGRRNRYGNRNNGGNYNNNNNGNNYNRGGNYR